MEIADSADAIKLYLTQKEELLLQMLGVYEKLNKLMQSEKHDETLKLLETVDALKQQVIELDENNSKYLGFGTGENLVSNDITVINERMVKLILDMQEIVQKITTLSEEKKNEFGRQLRLLKDGQKANLAYTSAPQPTEGFFVDFKK